MHEHQTQALIARLQLRRSELLASQAEFTEAMRPVELDQTTQGRLSHIEAIQQQHMAKASQTHLGLELSRIGAALARHAAGRFGQCCRCDYEIEPERLEAEPSAPFCIDCLTEVQDERRRQGHVNRTS